MQAPKELIVSVLRTLVEFCNSRAVSNTPARGAERTAADLKATASAAELSSPRCFDDKVLERFADAFAALEIRDSNFACL